MPVGSQFRSDFAPRVVVSLPAPIVLLLLLVPLEAVPLLVLLDVSLELGVVAAVLPLVLGVAAVLPVLGALLVLGVVPDELGVPGGAPLGVPELPVLAPSLEELEVEAPAAAPPVLCAMAIPPMAMAAAAARAVRVFLVVVMS